MLQQYGLAKKNLIVFATEQSYKITYAISALPGQSGSPIFV
jgi:hypothetical protein